MKKKLPVKIVLKIILFCLSSSVLFSAETNNSEKKVQAEARVLMGNVYESFLKIIPYSYSKDVQLNALKNKKEKEELLKNLNDLSLFFKSARHADIFKRPGFKPSLDSINSHLDETIASVESDNLIFAQKRLNTIGALCVTCHSQLPESVSKDAFGPNVLTEKRERFDSDFSYANYLYLIRKFDLSKKYFDKSLSEELLKGHASSSQQIVFILNKIISIDTKIKFNSKNALSIVNKWIKDSRLSSKEKSLLINWKETLVQWSDFNPNSIKSMSNFITTNLNHLEKKQELVLTGKFDITLLISSGVLLNYLVENPETELAPEILYWLSFAERRMGQTYFYSLADLYLKDCIKKYPSSPFAKKCYQEYADSVEAGFSGSSGINIPEEEKKELSKLKKLLKP